MSIGYIDNRTGDHQFATTQAQRKQIVMDKLRWHLENNPDLTLADIMELLKCSRNAACKWRKLIKEGK